MEEPKRPKISLNQLREAAYFFKYIRPYKFEFITGMILLFLTSVLVMAFPYLSGVMTDIAQGKSVYGLNLNQVGLVLLGILIIQGVFSYIRVNLFTVVSERSIADVRKDLYAKLISLPIAFYDKTRVGELLSRISADVEQLQQVLSMTLAEFVRQILILIIGIVLLLVTTPKLALVMLATFPIVVVGALFFGRFIRNKSKSRQQELAETNTIVDETLQSIQTVKSFTNEPYEFKRYSEKIEKVVLMALGLSKYRAAFGSFIIIILFGGIFFLLWYGATMVGKGQMTIGELVSFIAYTMFIGGAIGSLGNFYTTIASAIGGTERIKEILQHEQELDLTNKPNKIATRGEISFDNVWFSYPTRQDVDVLKGINLTIDPGQKVALVGASGAGKSTIAQLILRFYDLSSGLITIDGKDIRSFRIEDYRQSIGLVPQEVLLFGGTIRENILYGNPAALEEEVIDAAKRANAWEFIQSFPEGLDTIVGERGVKLSGGQRQRVAIARAILRDPQILILDEATSSLDAESEKLVQDALDKLMVGRTSIIIAHRLSTIKAVDRIYVLEDGQVAEAGTHDELYNLSNGLYAHLARMQYNVIAQN